MEKEKRFRQFEIMQQCSYMDDASLNHIQQWLAGLNDVAYLCVLHDMDETSPHYHIFVKMNDARTLDDIAKQCNIGKQYINIRSKSWRNALAYAFHKTDTSREDGKHEYDASAVVFAHNINYDAILENDEEYKHNKGIEALMYQYGECQITKRQLFENMTANDFNKHKRLYDNMRQYRTLKMEARSMQVMYITGPAGSGKTTLAKYMADQLKYDFFVSGSGKDPLDGYDKEECIILDDLRADSFTKAELFKLTDNNTNSSVKSRYNNKDISRCKLLIITSVKMPRALYDWNDDDEPADQFARRLGYTFINISSDNVGTVYECKLNKDLTSTFKDMKPAGFNMALVYGILNIVKDNNKASALLRAISDGVNDAYARKYGGSK